MEPYGNTAIELALFGQRGTINRLFVPREIEVPSDAKLRCLVFDGTAQWIKPGAGIGPLATVEQTITLESDFVLWGVTVFDSDNAGARMQIIHTIGDTGAQRSFFRTHVRIGNSGGSPIGCFGGTAQNPFLLTETYFLRRGDSLMVEVKNLSKAVAPNQAQVQVCLWGADLAELQQ